MPAPIWATALVLAEHWGVPPWTVTGEDASKVRWLWFYRAVEYYNAIAAAEATIIERKGD